MAIKKTRWTNDELLDLLETHLNAHALVRDSGLSILIALGWDPHPKLEAWREGPHDDYYGEEQAVRIGVRKLQQKFQTRG